MLASRPSVHPDLAAALRECRRAFWSVALFSGVVNLLMLAGPLYMLQIYDRVLTQPQRADAGRPVGVPGRRLRLPGRARPHPLARRRALGGAARPAPRRWRVHDAVVRLAVHSRHPGDGPSAGARPRSDPRLSDRRRSDRDRRPAVDAGLPGHLLPHSSLARRGVAGRRHRPVRDDAADRTGEPRAGAGGRAGRAAGARSWSRRSRRNSETVVAMGMARRAGAALGRGQRPLHRRRRPACSDVVGATAASRRCCACCCSRSSSGSAPIW